MSKNTFALAVLGTLLAASTLGAQTNPLWGDTRIKNYLPHMSWTEVEDLLTRTDMVIIPVGSLEQHGPHLPIGTDFLNGLERAKLVAQRTDVLVAPILFVGNAPYHLGFPGTVSLPAETIQKVYFEAAQSLMRHGFRRFLILNSHGGNRVISQYIADRINHETGGIAVELGAASAPFRQETTTEPSSDEPVFDRHGGVGETSGLALSHPRSGGPGERPDRHPDDAGAPGANASRGGRRRSHGASGVSRRESKGRGDRQGHLHQGGHRYRRVECSRPRGVGPGAGPPCRGGLRRGRGRVHRALEGTPANAVVGNAGRSSRWEPSDRHRCPTAQRNHAPPPEQKRGDGLERRSLVGTAAREGRLPRKAVGFNGAAGKGTPVFRPAPPRAAGRTTYR